MSNRPAGRHPRHVVDIASRFGNRHGGCAVEIQTAAGKTLDDWYPGTIREAVVAARTEYPGCRILSVLEIEWHDWILCLEDWASGP